LVADKELMFSSIIESLWHIAVTFAAAGDCVAALATVLVVRVPDGLASPALPSLDAPVELA
jgi:hypothetical protein